MSRVNHGIVECEINGAKYLLKPTLHASRVIDMAFGGLSQAMSELANINTEAMAKILSAACDCGKSDEDFRKEIIADQGSVELEVNGKEYAVDAGYKNLVRLEKSYGNVTNMLQAMGKQSLKQTCEILALLCGEKLKDLKTVEEDVFSHGIQSVNEEIGSIITEALTPAVDSVEPIIKFMRAMANPRGDKSDEDEPGNE